MLRHMDGSSHVIVIIVLSAKAGCLHSRLTNSFPIGMVRDQDRSNIRKDVKHLQ